MRSLATRQSNWHCQSTREAIQYCCHYDLIIRRSGLQSDTEILDIPMFSYDDPRHGHSVGEDRYAGLR